MTTIKRVCPTREVVARALVPEGCARSARIPSTRPASDCFRTQYVLHLEDLCNFTGFWIVKFDAGP